MVERKISDDDSDASKTIFALAKGFITSSHEWERTIRASGLSWRRAWPGHESALNAHRRSCLRQLFSRYKTMIIQVLQRGGLSSPWEPAFKHIGEYLHTHSLRVRDSRSFSPLLWEALLNSIVIPENLTEVTSLRRKFMLRQFVDEMSQDTQRNCILTLAYDTCTLTDEEQSELLDSLESAYTGLHEALRAHKYDLDQLTADTFTHRQFLEIDGNRPSSLLVYEDSLF